MDTKRNKVNYNKVSIAAIKLQYEKSGSLHDCVLY